MQFVICWTEEKEGQYPEEQREIVTGGYGDIIAIKRDLADDPSNTHIEHYTLKEAYENGIGFPNDDRYDYKTDSFLDEDVEEINNVIPLEETDHDYHRGLVGNFYSNEPNGRYKSWEEFKSIWKGFNNTDDVTNYDDRYHFLFRYDIHDNDKDGFQLVLCFMLQRKGIYSHMYIDSITEKDMPEITQWLKGRKDYLLALWKEV